MKSHLHPTALDSVRNADNTGLTTPYRFHKSSSEASSADNRLVYTTHQLSQFG